MAEYVAPPVSIDPEELFQEFVAYMQANVPGWEPADGNLDVWLAEGASQIGAQVGEVASDTLTSLFRWYGANLVGIPPLDSVAATGLATFTADISTGYTVPAGTTIGLDPGDGSLVLFQTVSNAVIPNGSTSIAGVPITATDGGAAGNLLSGPAQLVDSLADITAVTVAATTSGGQDAEEDDAYLARLVEELRLLTPRPILPVDFSVLARKIAEVSRAVTLDLYNPADGTSNNPRMVTVVAVNSAGQPLSAGGKTALNQLYNGNPPAQPALRETNFVVNIADPDYTAVGVAFTAEVYPGFLPADVGTEATAAIAAFLDPSTWGQPTFGDPGAPTGPTDWENEPLVRLGQLYDVLYGVVGLRHVTALTVGLSGGALAATDYALPTTNANPVPLPTAGTITATMS